MTDLSLKYVGVERGEYYHLDEDCEGAAGPFDTIEAAKEDALKILHNSSYHVSTIKIVKVVAESSTKVSYATTWTDGLPDPRG